MSNIENVIKFFGGNDGSISCKVTYTTLSDSDEVVLRDEPITLCLDGDRVVYLFQQHAYLFHQLCPVLLGGFPPDERVFVGL